MSYISGGLIRKLRERKKLTQKELTSEKADEQEHHICVETIDDEYHVFMGHGYLYAYCNRHGLVQVVI